MATTSLTRSRQASRRPDRRTARLVLCGSMSAYGRMLDLQDELKAHGLMALVPDLDDDVWATSTVAEARAAKRRASIRHFHRIQDRRTLGVLVANIDKYGVHDYIGPNAFAEVAVAFASRRRIFVLQGIPDSYRSELDAWGATALHGDLTPVIQLLHANQITPDQLRFFF